MVYGQQHEARALLSTVGSPVWEASKKERPCRRGLQRNWDNLRKATLIVECGNSDNHLWYRLLTFSRETAAVQAQINLTVMFCDLGGSMRRYGGPLARRFEPQLAQLPDQRATVMSAAATAPITLQGQD